jgi:sugar lactone lactonase YvrE
MIPLGVAPSGTRAQQRRWMPHLRAVQAIVILAATASTVAGGMWATKDAISRIELASVPPVPVVVTPPPIEVAGGVVVASNGDIFIANARLGQIRRMRPQASVSAMPAENLLEPRALPGTLMPFIGATDVAMAGNSDLFVVDAQNNRVCRIDRRTGKVLTVAGTGAAGFDGDGKQATQSALNMPSAVAVARNGDLYIVDTLNHRVRVVEQATGLIKTVAGDGDPADGEPVGDDGPANVAHLSRPSDLAVAPNGDLYIADTGHNRIRRVNITTGIITTVAGDGSFGSSGDGSLATSASLAGPAGLALVPNGKHLTIYIADYFSGSIRMVSERGVISTFGDARRFTSPTRLAYHPAGWLYIVDASPAGVTALAVSKAPRDRMAERSVWPRNVT